MTLFTKTGNAPERERSPHSSPFGNGRDAPAAGAFAQCRAPGFHSGFLLLALCFLTLFPFPVRQGEVHALSGDAPIRIVDDAGRTCLLPAPAARIVSLYAGHSENAAALGAGARLVAVSRADDARLFPDVPRFPAKIDAERILALAPDLVLVRPLVESLSPGAVATLERAGVAVVSLAPPEWEDMPAYLERLGALLGVRNGGKTWERTLDELALVSEEAARRRGAAPAARVFLESTGRDLHTCAPRSWAAHLLAVAGGENVAADLAPLREGSALAACGVERLLAYATQGLDVYLVQRGPMNDTTEEAVRARPWSAGLGDARIVTVPEELVSRPSLLRVAEGARMLLDLFYPEQENASRETR